MPLGPIKVLADMTLNQQELGEAELEKLRKAAEPVVDGSHVLTEDQRKSMLQAMAAAYAAATGGTVAALQLQIGLWRRKKGFKSDWENVPEKLMLTVSELSEAMEAFRHLDPEFLARLSKAPDGDPAIEVAAPPDELLHNIPILENFEEELADVFVRLTDLCDALGLDLEGAIFRKMAVNELRPYKHGVNC